jgi:hypothetical protein
MLLVVYRIDMNLPRYDVEGEVHVYRKQVSNPTTDSRTDNYY